MATRQEARNARPDARNVHAPPGMHWCSEGHYAPVGEFARNRAKKDGLHNRCRHHERLYRLEYEAMAGKRSELTKTLRVDNATHGYILKLKGRDSVGQFLRRATAFYLANVCGASDCLELGERRYGGRCAECAT